MRKMSYVELVVLGLIVLVGGFLVFLQSGPLITYREHTQNLDCMGHLRQISNALFQYESPEQFGKAPYQMDTPLAERNTPALAFAPLLTLLKTGLLKDQRIIACPRLKSPLPVLEEWQLAAPTGVPPAGQTGYLFTYYYQNSSPGNRVIAGDASADDGFGYGYSANHGDTARNKRGRFGGANAVFRDWHVKECAPGYTVEGAQTKVSRQSGADDLWDAGGVEYDEGTDSATGTQIAPYR